MGDRGAQGKGRDCRLAWEKSCGQGEAGEPMQGLSEGGYGPMHVLMLTLTVGNP